MEAECVGHVNHCQLFQMITWSQAWDSKHLFTMGSWTRMSLIYGLANLSFLISYTGGFYCSRGYEIHKKILMISWYDQSLTPEISAVCGKLILLKLNHDSFCTCLSIWSDVVYLIWSFICCFLPGLFDLYVKFYNLDPECDVILECGYWSKTWNMQLPRMFTVAPLP